MSSAPSARVPTVFLPHGGGPWPFVETGLGSPDELGALRDHLRSVSGIPAAPPRALLVISAHWQAPVPTVTSGAHPPLLYDYSGFAPAAYTLTWPAPGDPTLAARVRSLLEGAGMTTAEDPARGFDHGIFVPLAVAYPEAAIPTVQLSMRAGLDPSEHLAMGRALAPLRDEGVFIVGSGMTYHNLRTFNQRARPAAESFEGWLRETVTLGREERETRLASWWDAPGARLCHPHEEHLLPLMVVAGAAGEDVGSVPYRGTIFGLHVSAYRFG